ncbi:hypothetical protein [Lactiplantibacillus mudanjiangensis]|uniref:Uncharacterized protein n=1 Tax=Lactiplantibacillus mudanjiangensis TaxID=1296538 RepID=A0A660DXV6_9LACO|nr:hypothetical protein [Lactiplantibacillus mudanjiangensis]VDG25142.1 hypothetical protein [Lactobacillus parabuchneri] [Lactiplantibacillus mudanjiangensis]VDG28099.1 hypothetical protein [Lactobacillus parabuchneri] [Lactiplantibacillus mudanjiangensis]
MFTWSFWILAVWFVVNAIWMWFDLDNQQLQKTFVWINVVALVWGFGVFYGGTSVANLSGWVQALNWLNVILTATQCYFGYRKLSQHKPA